MVFYTNIHMGNPTLITEAVAVSKDLPGWELCRRTLDGVTGINPLPESAAPLGTCACL